MNANIIKLIVSWWKSGLWWKLNGPNLTKIEDTYKSPYQA